MKLGRIFRTIIAATLCFVVVAGLFACSGGRNDEPEPTPTPTPTAAPTPPPSTPEPTPAPVVLAPYDGVVEHLFFHEVIAFPELAFRGGTNQSGFDTNMVTVHEYNLILESLYKNNFVLIDLNDVWSEFTNDAGQQRMRRNTLMIPEGKKPLVISFDDLSFYAYMMGNGFMERYIIGEDGNIWAEGTNPNGSRIVSQDLAAITILDKFVKDNPGFSHNGAKGCIALTGYEGILGYRTNTDRNDDSDEFRLNRMKEVARVQPVVQRLKETGWYFATHSYGHINLETAALSTVQADANRWMDEVGSLVGETQIFIYPFGSRLDGGDVGAVGPAFRFYQELGFRLFASVGREPYTQIKSGISAVIMDRMAVDGFTLRQRRSRFIRFFDAKEVFDHVRPEEYEINWDN
jgi:hypothetical protein